MRKTRIILFVLFLFTYFICRLYPVQVKKIEVKSYKDFQKGNCIGTNIDNRGMLSIGHEIKIIKGPEREYYLSLDFINKKEIFVGVGHGAGVYKIVLETGEVKEHRALWSHGCAGYLSVSSLAYLFPSVEDIDRGGRDTLPAHISRFHGTRRTVCVW